MAGTTEFRGACAAAIVLGAFTMTGPALAASACSFEAQGEGRVSAILDARSFRMDDGREVRLAGIETVTTTNATAALNALVTGRNVVLR
ncbi:MAG TPA: hypothetical protein VGO84_00645, partial [Burkholderiales bacterium]|nr:hypothetical protein [Burkholderiales bacterium]